MTSLTDTSSAKMGLGVTPDNNAVIQPTRGLYVGTAGDLVVKWSGNGEITVLKALAAGLYPFSVTQVRLTGTTAADIVALW